MALCRRRLLQGVYCLVVTVASAGSLAQLPAPYDPPWDFSPPPELLPPNLPPGGLALMCELRDEALGELFGDLGGKLGLDNLGRNLYCDGGCFMCCWSPGSGAGSTGGCHTSFDYSDEGFPPINCDAGLYGSGTTIVGEALIVGDPLGTGFCAGGVQQLCTHFPVCTTNGGPPASTNGTDPLAASPAQAAFDAVFMTQNTGSPAPHPDMLLPGANGSRAKAFLKLLYQRYHRQLRERPPETPFKGYVDWATGRGMVNWASVMQNVEPYSGVYDLFRVDDANGNALPRESFQKGVQWHTQVGLIGVVPNLFERLDHVESRYWTEAEITSYLGGTDPTDALLETMNPLALDVLKQVPIQDWRLLAVPAPSETPLAYRSFDGFELGSAPTVSVAQDCSVSSAVRVAVRIDDPSPAATATSSYPLVIGWGDGSYSRHSYDGAQPANVFEHSYETAGAYQVHVTTSNDTGLRGVGGLVVNAAAGSAIPVDGSLASIEFDQLDGYGPALIRAGFLSFELEAVYADGTRQVIGWSRELALANAGPTSMGRIKAHNENRQPMTRLILKPTTYNAYFHDNVHFKLPSLTLGFVDEALGTIVEHTLPVDEHTFEVYYQGAASPVPPQLHRRDVNGRIMFPVDLVNNALPAGHCGANACRFVDRIELPLTPALLALNPATPYVPASATSGDAARWVEDTPNRFLPVADLAPVQVSGSCNASITQPFVAGEAPGTDRIQSLTIAGPAPTLTGSSTEDLTASATLSDGSVVDVTDRATWSSSEPLRVEVSNGAQKGQLSTGTLAGTSIITATLGTHSATIAATNATPASGYRFYRFLITQIHGDRGRAGINGLELLVNGEVLQNAMTSATAGTFGPYPADISSSDGTGLGAFDANMGSGWSSANNSFETTAPFAVGPTPVYLQVEFEERVPVHGIRLHRQPGILAVSFEPQFPKVIEIQASDDGVSFSTIETHTVTNWDYTPYQLTWSLAAASAPGVQVPLPPWLLTGLALSLLGFGLGGLRIQAAARQSATSR